MKIIIIITLTICTSLFLFSCDEKKETDSIEILFNVLNKFNSEQFKLNGKKSKSEFKINMGDKCLNVITDEGSFQVCGDENFLNRDQAACKRLGYLCAQWLAISANHNFKNNVSLVKQK